MKSDPSFPEIGDLLRAHKPEAETPLGMEARILRAIRDHQQPPASRVVWWPWLAIPTAMAVAALFLRAPSVAPDGIAETTAPAADIIETPEFPTFMSAATTAARPLQTESLALAHDARRMGNFLIDCLPSYTALASAE